MPRPPCCRRVQALPEAICFKPAGVPRCELEEVTLAVDEFEALRLADLEGLYQDAAAAKMGISRQTFGRIVASARRKVAEALVQAKALRIEGGVFSTRTLRAFCCRGCEHRWQVSPGSARPAACPACQGSEIQGAGPDAGPGKRRKCNRRGGREA